MDIYRVSDWGKPVGMGVSGASFVKVSAVCKSNGPQDPYVVANELIAAELGRILKLPVPPGFVIVDGDQNLHFASLDFNLAGVALPPIVPNDFVAAFPEYVGAILVFDVFIANSDRHAGNISADYGNPPRFNLFDHGLSLLGGHHHGVMGVSRLHAAAGALVIDGGIGGNRHVLRTHIQDDTLFSEFLDRLEAVPNYFIRETVAAGADFGLSPDEVQQTTNFLLQRRTAVRGLISQNKQVFSGITQWRLL